MHLDGQVTKAVSGVSQNHDVPSAQRTINPIAELIRKGALEAGIRQGSNRAVTKVQRMINSLQWRQAHSKDEFYPLALESGKVLHIKQLQCGEITGLGTGATVWPAAHVLAKYIERRCGEGGLRGSRVVDLGSGTGVGGIVAAALGAEETFLTDQQQLLFLMRENAERCCGTSAVGGSRGNTDTVADERLETALTTKIGRPNNGGVYNNGDSRFGNSGGENKGSNDATRATDNPNQHQDKESAPSVHVLTYDWGMKDDQLSRPVDIILVSDCVLPKLYPIEPLVDAIDKLSGPNTTTFLSYEHRHYQAFDPRRRFEELVTARGFTKLNIPHAQQHPIFSADDIEIWEVRRSLRPLSQAARTEASIAVSDGGEQKAAGDNTATPAEGVTPSAVGRASVVVSHSTLGGEDVHVCSENAGTMVTLLEERHELAQSLSGSIGSYLWPSAIVMARHLVASCCISPSAKGSTPASGHTSSVGDASGESAFSSSSNGFSSSYPARVVALELGSGVGLVAMTAALLGWDVVGTDKADALPLLRANVTKCLSSTKRELWWEEQEVE